MKSQLIIPATIAAVFHLGLLFGFNHPPIVAPDNGGPEEPPSEWERLHFVPFPEEIVLIEDLVEAAPPDERAMPNETTLTLEPMRGELLLPIIDSNAHTDIHDQIQVEGGAMQINQWRWGDGIGPTGHVGAIGVLGLDRPARATLQSPPIYPANLRREGVEGHAEVAFVVDEEGSVMTASVLNTTHREFAIEAERAVRKWRFKPGQQNGKPVRFKMTVPIVFSISDRD